MAVRGVAADSQREEALALAHRTIREMHMNPEGVVVEDRQEISEFAFSILNDKVNDAALGFFCTIIHYLYYWFSTPYSTLYDFKAAMLDDHGIDTENALYATARIFRFADGTPLYDFANRLAVSQNQQGRDVISMSGRHYPMNYHPIFFPEDQGGQPVFSREEGTKHLMARIGRGVEISEMGLNGAERNHWAVDNRAQMVLGIRTYEAKPYDDVLDDEVYQPQPPDASQSANQLENDKLPETVIQQLKAMGYDQPPPRVHSAQGVLIFNASGRAVRHLKIDGEEGYGLFLATDEDCHNTKKMIAQISDDKGKGLPTTGYHRTRYLNLTMNNLAEDFAVIENGTNLGYRIRQPGKQPIIIKRGSYTMSCEVVQKPLPLQQIPARVQHILDTHPLLKNQDRTGMITNRVLSSQGLDMFYFGKRNDIDLFQYSEHHYFQDDRSRTDNHLRLNHPGWTLKGGDVRLQDDSGWLTFKNSRGPDDIVLITDFVNPSEPKETRYLIIQPDQPDLELYFTKIAGTPTCRPLELENPKKD